MEFCPECGTLLVPKQVDYKKVFACPTCGFTKEASDSRDKYVISNSIPKRNDIVVVKDEIVPYPVTRATCKKCNNTEAYYYAVQTRGGDESETVYLTCTKCKHVWKMTS